MAEAAGEFDVAVLGAGPGGMAAAERAALRGARTCLIERGRLGGVCLNAGCVPTKAMLAGSARLWQIARAEAFGIRAGAASVDGPAFMRRVGEVVASLRAAAERRLSARKGLEVLCGRGRLTGRGRLAVETAEGERRIRARSIVIATGARPIRPAGLPWDSPRVMTSDAAATATDLPTSALVVGGGVLGCEFATAYAELGARVVLVEMLERLLSGFEAEASEAVAASLTERGVEVLTGRTVAAVRADDDGVEAQLDDGRTLAADCALLAVGRRANVEGIGLEAAGVSVAGGIVPVDERCRTSAPGVYAVGDVAEQRQYAHLAERMGFVAAENATGHELADDRRVVPVGAYTHPEVAAVGQTEAQARAEFGAVRVLRYSYRNSPAAVACGETDGQVKVVADSASGRILGALWIGPRAIDMIQEPALAVRHGLSVQQVYHTMHAHPTLQEAFAAALAPWAARAARRQP